MRELSYVRIHDSLQEVWDGKELVFYQVGDPATGIIIMEPEIFERFLAAQW